MTVQLEFGWSIIRKALENRVSLMTMLWKRHSALAGLTAL